MTRASSIVPSSSSSSGSRAPDSSVWVLQPSGLEATAAHGKPHQLQLPVGAHTLLRAPPAAPALHLTQQHALPPVLPAGPRRASAAALTTAASTASCSSSAAPPAAPAAALARTSACSSAGSQTPGGWQGGWSWPHAHLWPWRGCWGCWRCWCCAGTAKANSMATPGRVPPMAGGQSSKSPVCSCHADCLHTRARMTAVPASTSQGPTMH